MSDPKSPWYHRIWFVVGLLVTIGPFGFPFLWKSKEFSRPVKWTLTIVFTLVTFLCIWLSVETVKLVLSYVRQIQKAIY